MTSLPPSPGGSGVEDASSLSYLVRFDDLAAALLRLGIDVDSSVILQTVKEEELKKAPERLAARQAAVLKFAAEHPESAPATTSTTPYKPITIKNYPPSTDPLTKLRRDKLWEMTKELFPPGKPLPDPYLTA